MAFIMGSWKIVQRRTYDILSHKYSFVFVLLGFLTLTVSIIQFGEVWIEWNQSDNLFNSFSDNVIGKSLQKKLCQALPIDVVYTWVNGSDPLLLQQIKDYQEQTLKDSIPCQYKNCISSRFAAFRGWMGSTNNLSRFKKVHISVKSTTKEVQNWTLVEYPSPLEALLASLKKLEIGRENVTLFQAHWTSYTNAPNSYLVPHAAVVDGLPSYELSKIKDASYAVLATEIHTDISHVWVHTEKKTVILEFSTPTACDRFLQKGNRTLFNHKVVVTKAYLILKFPPPWDIKDIAPSRFEDKEELRYSLRSLEMYAPWVRHVYLVTNGQIPYWLNLDNPRLTVLTHEDIFPNHSHLPTFSSPAIESHLHQIPGLSQQFLYLNDDVFFGHEVWPEDFITHATGQKVYLSWAVPDCAESCPWSWIADGSCDISCNISACSFDGGDCNPANGNEIVYDEHHSDFMDYPIEEHVIDESHFLDFRELSSFRELANEAEETTILHKLALRQQENLAYAMQLGPAVGRNLASEEVKNYSPWFLKKAFPKADRAVPSRHLTFYENRTASNLAAEKSVFLKKLYTSYSDRQDVFERISTEKNISDKLNTIPEDVAQGDLAKRLRSSILRTDNSKSRRRATNSSSPNRRWRSLSQQRPYSTKGRNSLLQIQTKDTFAESLLFVNRLYNNEFGFEVRKVPAHMPHLIDKTVMEVMQNRFPLEWELTSSHKIRSPHDMQYAFSYFYFLMSEKQNRTLYEIFDIFDTDKSGTWSDREIRTLLTQLNDLPLSYQKVLKFEEQICNCSQHFEDEKNIPTPPYERYQDSKLPVVSKQLIDNCEPIKQVLLEKFGSYKKYKTEVIKDKNQAVTFKMLSSNLSQLILMLDEVRRGPKKFICLNDNLDPSMEKENAIVRAVLQDFYESLFPLPSAFELPPEYRNRFLHMSELEAWRSGRALLRNGIYLCLSLLITFTILSFLQVEVCTFQRRRVRKIYQDV